MKKLLRYFYRSFFAECLVNILNSSLLSGGVVALMAMSGTWQYLGSTLYAHDLQRSAVKAETMDNLQQPLLILVDDAAYENFFKGQSPLPRTRVLAFLKTIAQNTPASTRIVLDIDLSPAQGQEREQAALDAFFREQPTRWVLPAAKFGQRATQEASRQWREGLCAAGVGFGLPYVPTEFGYPVLTHQFQNGLADAALQPTLPCADPTQPYVRKALPLQGAMLKTGQVLPFSGDVQGLGQMVQAIAPSMVVIGGAWGQGDVFGTPFGERFGVQIHAAALAGGMSNARLASNGLELLVVWVFVSFIATLLGFFAYQLQQLEGHSKVTMAGHEFFREKLKPALFIGLTLLLLMGLSDLLALLQVHTGVWISTSKVGCITLGTMLLTWDWGRSTPVQYSGFGHAWEEVIAKPVRADVASMRQSLAVVLDGKKWRDQGLGFKVTRLKAAMEGVLATVGLASKTVLPVGSVVFAVMKPV